MSGGEPLSLLSDEQCSNCNAFHACFGESIGESFSVDVRVEQIIQTVVLVEVLIAKAQIADIAPVDQLELEAVV